MTHRDWSILPLEPDIRDINLVLPTDRIPRDDDAKHPRPATPAYALVSKPGTPHFSPTSGYTQATHVIRPPTRDAEPVLQTTNPIVPINPDAILGVARLERALPLRDPRVLLDIHPEGSDRRVYLAGSYAYPGIPLLEGCVGSAKIVIRDILGHEASLDWETGRGSLLGRIWRWRR